MKNDKQNKNTDKPFYHGHRQRLRTRYIEKGIDSLLEHEILEFILFHSVPRVDTKPMAHKLLDAYGSLKNVLDASFESLKENGLSEISAAHITLFKDIHGWLGRNKIAGLELSDYNEMGRLVASELDGASSEKVVALLLDGKNNVIKLVTVCEGSFRSARVNMRKLVKECLDRKAVKVVLAHNHPSGNIRPSADDYVTTTSVENHLEGIDVELMEHFIVADGTFLGLKQNMSRARDAAELEYKKNLGMEEDEE